MSHSRLERKKTSFSSQVLTLVSGASIAQFIPIAISPILSRIYTPEDFGILTLFSAITAILSIATTAKYEHAIVLPENEKDGLVLTLVAVLINLIFSLFLFLIILFFYDYILIILNSDQIGIWLFFIPIANFLIGLYNALNYLHIRYERYGTIAKANISRTTGLAITQIGLGLIKSSPAGLILGKLSSYLFSNMTFSVLFFNKRKFWSELNRHDLKRVAHTYIKFPKFSLPALFAGGLSRNLLNFFISNLYSATMLGFYGLLDRVLGLPINLISSSFAQVFLKKASKDRKLIGSAKTVFVKVLIRLIAVGILIFVPLYFVIEDIFGIVFGNKWIIAGTFAKIMLPLFFTRFIVIPLSAITIAFEKQKEMMYWQITLLVLGVIIYLITSYLKLDISIFFVLTSAIFSVHYLVLLGLVYKYSLGEE